MINLKLERSLSHDEEYDYAHKNYDKFSPTRLEEIKHIKEMRKERYLDMLGSPIPEVFQNRASLIGMIDDAQDALSVVAAVGIVASRLLSGSLAKILAGPFGWMLLAADMLNLMNTILSPVSAMRKVKHNIEDKNDLDPKSKKARSRATERAAKLRLGTGTAIEALQVTDNVFGFGVCLGPIMNLPLDIVFGAGARLMGKPVTVHWPVPDVPHWARRAMKLRKVAGSILHTSFEKDPDFLTLLHVGNNAAAQVENAYAGELNRIDEIDDIHGVELEAPKVTSLLTQSIIDEVDPGGEIFTGWPQTSQKWATIQDLNYQTWRKSTDNLNTYMEDNKHDARGFIGAINATEATLFSMENLGGPGSVEIDHKAETKAINGLCDAGYGFPPDMTEENMKRWRTWVYNFEFQGTSPTVLQCTANSQKFCGFTFVNYGY